VVREVGRGKLGGISVTFTSRLLGQCEMEFIAVDVKIQEAFGRMMGY
jgi:hypothetical protein